jgi:hypothetical protein
MRDVPAEYQGVVMAHYMLAVHSGQGEAREPVSEEETHRSFVRLGEIEQEMAAAGAWVFSGRLHEPDTATVVRVSGGEVLTTDGPFAESKEHLGGFYVIEAADLDAALGWAGKVTEAIGVPIEVRPFAGFADKPQAF